MIRSFRSKALRRLFEDDDASKLSVPNVRRVQRILETLDGAKALADMDVSGWRLHPLKGASAGRHAVDASANWRVTFAWDDGGADDVDLEDYH